MKRETQDKWINAGSSLLTLLVITGAVYFSISSYQKFQQSALDDNAVKISDENKIAKSERIDTKEVENELNRIAEEQRLEQERIAAEKAAREKAERERIEAEKKAAEKAAQEKLAREKAERERIEAEKKAAEKAAQEKLAREKAERERMEAEKKAAEKRAQEKLAQEKAEQARVAAEKKQAQEKAAQEKAAQEKAESERKAAEKRASEQKAAEEKRAAERAEKERLEKERLEKERLAAEKKEADRQAAEAQKAEEAARIADAINSEYQSKVRDYLYALWITPSGSYGLATTIQFKVKEDGTIIGTPVIKKSSGNEEFDNSVFVAIMSADKIPMPNDPIARKYIAKEGFELTFKPTN